MSKIILIISIFILSCSNQTIYSGKILNDENIKNINFKNKKTLIEQLGEPSFKDPIENKFLYFAEKKNKRSIFKTEIEYSFLFVFDFDEKNDIKSSKVYDLKNQNDIEKVKDITSNDIIKRGLIEKVFGGVGAQQELPTTP